MTGEIRDPFDDSSRGEERKVAGELEELRAIAEDRQNTIERITSEFQEYRRQCEAEKTGIMEFANETLIADLLCLLDDFDHVIPQLATEKNRDSVRAISQKLSRVLSGYGLRPIECMGKKFDPRMHEVLYIDKCDVEDGVIIEEYQKGYMLRTKVIRPAKVKIIRHASSEGSGLT
jgi:molecular chaperone GrpE